MKQFDIVWVDLDPAKGRETQKQRPCLILSNDVFNQGQLIIVAPFLKYHTVLPWAVEVKPTPRNKLDQPRIVDLRQLRTVDRQERISRKNGSLENIYHEEILKKLSLVFEPRTVHRFYGK